MCLKIYEVDLPFFSASGLAWKVALKKTKVILDVFTNIDMLLMVEKRINRFRMGFFWAAHPLEESKSSSSTTSVTHILQ